MKNEPFDFNTFYSNIEAERARNRWSIAEVSEKLGISERTYRFRLAEAKDIHVSMLIKYAKLFNCSTDYLLGIDKN